jgi:hypothetical protein
MNWQIQQMPNGVSVLATSAIPWAHLRRLTIAPDNERGRLEPPQVPCWPTVRILLAVAVCLFYGAGRMTSLSPLAELVAPKAELAFFYTQMLDLPRPMEAMEAWDMIMADPLPFMTLAFRIRDAISARFGVKKIGGFSGKRPVFLREGDYLDFFLIEKLTPHVLVLTERDRHLDVMTCVTTENQVLAVTSSVKTHNLFGKVYMLAVGPAHKVIVRMMLSRLKEILVRKDT